MMVCGSEIKDLSLKTSLLCHFGQQTLYFSFLFQTVTDAVIYCRASVFWIKTIKLHLKCTACVRVSYDNHHSSGDFGKLGWRRHREQSMRTSRRWDVEPRAHPPRHLCPGGSDSVGPGWCTALSTYLVCWANPGTLVKMFMSALRGNKKAP